jgi:L-amino acid N-acyltransferase YncA
VTSRSTASITLRPATEADLPAIVAIYNESIPGRLATADTEPVTVEARRPWFVNRDPARHPVFVAETEAQILGWGALNPFFNTRPAYHRTAEVSLYVTTRRHRSGVGRLIYPLLEETGARSGLATIVALVFAHNPASIRFYESRGFHPWGHLPRVAELDHTERDLLILGKRVQQ